MSACKIYCTSYCNMGHRVSDGKPVEHECVIIPPAALRAEMEDRIPEAIEIMSKARDAGKLRVMRRGVRGEK